MVNSSRASVFAANWKMNMRKSEALAFFDALRDGLKSSDLNSAEIVVAPPFTLLSSVFEHINSQEIGSIALAAQNMHWEDSGAHTGEISAPMLRECGVSHVVLGHSERRAFYGESSPDVAKRAIKALASDIVPIVCIGEKQSDFENGLTKEVVKTQLVESTEGIEDKAAGNLIIAYEPVWAIGTGLAATPEIVSDVHSFIRQELSGVFTEELASGIRILYGGSVKPENISDLMEITDVDGALIGGASLKAASFLEIIENGSKSAG